MTQLCDQLLPQFGTGYRGYTGPTRELVTLLEKLAKDHLRFIFTAEPKKLASEHIHLEKEHVCHLHVRLLQ